MGCTQSKIELEESVARCRDRKQQLRDAVGFRNAFAAAHSAYAVALKNTGAALSDYAHGESLHPYHLTHLHHLSHSHSASASASASAASAATSSSAAAGAATAVVGKPPVDTLFPPPPPPAAPDFSPIQRSASMPADLPLSKPPRKPAKDPLLTLPSDSSILEEDEDDDDDDDDGEEDGHGHGHGHEHGAEDEEEEEMEPRRAAAVPQPPPRPPRPPQPKPAGNPVATSPPPPMPESKGMETFDYFFGPEYTVPPPTLGELEEQVLPSWPERRDLDTDRRPNKVSSADDPVATIAPEKEAVPPRPPPAKPAKKVKQGGGGPVHHQHAASAGAAVPMESSLKKGKAVVVASVAGQPSLNLVQLLNQLDDHFLHAFLSAHEVSKMLESTRMHYHSNFVDKRGHIDHSARVMKAITWNRSFKGLAQTPDDANDDFDKDEWETHATILDKMLAWEKKLYDEVKAGELMKIEYKRKVALLNKQKKHGVRPEVLEKTKSAVSHLHTRYIVDMQSMDSTVSEINRLRDHQLYPKLVDLVDGMGKMWGTMYEHHRSQLKIVTGLRAFDISLAPKETSEEHHERTIQLCNVVREWHSQFQKLVKHQKEYIKALDSWLKLNLIPIESSLKEKVSSPPRQADPPIKKLLHAWNDFPGNLPDELARTAINSFAEVIHNIVVYQQDELKSKHKCDETRRELDRKKRQFDDWHRKYMERRASMGEESTTESGEGGNRDPTDPVVERKIAVEALEIRLKEEEENHRKQCKQVREKSLGSLRMHLPELFRSLSEFASVISEKYKKLWRITQSQEEDED